MQLIESVSRDLPMMLLVHIPNGHGVHQYLIQTLDTCLAHFLTQRVWQLRNRSERLNFRDSLANLRPRSLRVIVKSKSRIAGFSLCFRAHNFWFVICSIKVKWSVSISPSYPLSLIKKQGGHWTPICFKDPQASFGLLTCRRRARHD